MSADQGSIHPESLPPLVEGERLDQAQFHERYEAMPTGTGAELIDGVVSMPGPVGAEHGRAHVPVFVWLGSSQENTEGVEVLDHIPIALSHRSEPQPDALVLILAEYEGGTKTDRRFLRGIPELVVEVTRTSRYADLGTKLHDV